MNRRYSWTSHSEGESDYQREPDWQEVRFPLKFPQDAVDEYERLEWSVEVTTPDQEIIAGVARMRRDQVNIRFQPFRDGVHGVQVLTDGRPFCAPLYFDVLDDGAFRRLASPPGGGAGGEGVQQQQQRSRMLKKRRDRGSSKSNEPQLSDGDDESAVALQAAPRRAGAAEKRQQQPTRRRPRGEPADRQKRHSGYHSGYQPSESDQYEHRHRKQRDSRSSLERSGQQQQQQQLRPRRDSSFRGSSLDRSRPQSAASGTAVRTAVSPRRPSRSASQTSYDRGRAGDATVPTSGGGGGGGGDRGGSYRRASSSQHLQRRDSSLSRYSSDQDRSRPPSASQQRKMSAASSAAASPRRHQRSVSDTESLISRRDSFNASQRQSSAAAAGHRNSRISRGSRYSSADEQGFVEAGHRHSRTSSELRDDGAPYRRTQSPPHSQQQQQQQQQSVRHQSASNIRQQQQQQQQPFRQRQVSAFALGAVPARTSAAMPFGANKSGPFDGQAPLMNPLRQPSVEEAGDFEVVSSPTGGESFILKGRQMLAIRTLGKSAGGEELVQSEDGSIFLIKHGRAVPMRQGYSAPGRSQSPPPPLLSQQTQRLVAPPGRTMAGTVLTAPIPPNADGKPRCCVCNKKATNAKQRASIEGLLYCHKHFKDLFFHKPADSHKKYLFVDLTDIPSPGMPLHPRANFTALSFKEFLKAQEEFKKYDFGNRGMIPKDSTFPILQQLLIRNGVKERKLQQYFNGPQYPKLLMDVQAADEAEVSELQFLNLLAMITRETTRKWLQNVKLNKSKQLTKAWSTTALDSGRAASTLLAGAGAAADFSSQSYTGMGPVFSAAPRQIHAAAAAGQKQLRQSKRTVSTSVMPQARQQPAKTLHQQRRHTEAALNYQQPTRRRQTSSSRDDDDDDDDGDDDDDDDQDRYPAMDHQAYPKHRPNGRGSGARPRSEESGRRSHRRREDPEGRSHEDVSLSGTRGGGGGGGHAGKSGPGYGSEVAATKPARSPPSAVGGSTGGAGAARPRTSQAAQTREEALAARAQLQQILRKEGAVSVSGSGSGDIGHEDNEGEGDVFAPPPAPGRGGGAGVGQSARRPGQEPGSDSEDEDSEEESEGSGVDSEQLLEESDEEEEVTQEVVEVPISGNRVADAWMLY